MSAQDIKGAKALAKSLEDYKVRVEADPDAKFWFKDVETVYSKLYRYSSWIPDLVDGVRKLEAHNANGWHVTSELFDNVDTAAGRLQLPLENPKPRYRIEIETGDVKNNTRIPKGRGETAGWYEPRAQDYIGDPDFGQPGGAIQMLIDGQEIKIKSIIDIELSQQIYP